jgi:hypothetical protein
MSAAPRKAARSPVGRQRTEFLRRCRARIQPADLGLPASRYKRTGGLRRNLLEILLSSPVRHMTAAQLETTARRLIARLRFDYSRNADDPRFEAFIARLDALSPLFRRLWRIPEFTLRGFGIHRFTHPRFGALAFEHTSCVPDGHQDIRVVICMPDNAAAKRAVAQANAELATG